MKKFFKEFEKFAVKGNAFDLAVGVVIGAAFTAITNSLVNDILNPIFGIFTGRVDFSDKAIIIREATDTAEALVINYGAFLNTIINFLIVAFALFLMVKQINKLRERMEEKAEDPNASAPEPPQDIKLLTEIRDELKRQNDSEKTSQ